MQKNELDRSVAEGLDILDRPIPDVISRNLIDRGERRSLIGTIPLSRVITDHSLIDEHHVQELANSMKTSDRGQISPTTVRARIDAESDEVVFDVVDGFHRTEALRRNGSDTVRVSSMYSCSDEELYDLRILAAQSVQSVQYARVATWMRLAFDNTPWAAKGMDVTHAFGVTLNDTKRPQRVDLAPEEVDAMKEWVRGTSDRWNKGLNQTYQTLKLVDEADPSLVEQVRTQGGGKDRKAVVSPTLLKLTVEAFPGSENYSNQNAVMDFILDKRFYIPQARAFVELATPFLHEGMSREAATQAILQNVDFDRVGIVFEKQKPKKNASEVRDVTRRNRKNLADSREQVKDLQKTIDDQDKTIGILTNKLSQVEDENENLRFQIYGLNQQVAALKNSNNIFKESKPNVGLSLPKSKLDHPKKTEKAKLETSLSPEQVQADFMKKFGELRIPTLVSGFFLNHDKYIRENNADPIDRDVVDVLGEAFSQVNPNLAPFSSADIHQGRIEGLTVLKQFANLPSALQEQVVQKLSPEVQNLVKYGQYLNEEKLLNLLVGLAKEEGKGK